jgi:integrase/recombinase XerD
MEGRIMAVVDRTKYMSVDEVKQLRTVAEARAIVDLKAGRVNGVLGWMLVDFALSTGLRVSEIAKVAVEDIDLKRGLVTVSRAKKRKSKREPLAIGKELAEHLKDYLTWRSCRLSDFDGSPSPSLTATKGPLFIGCRGPLTAQGLQRVWKAAIKRASLPGELSIHSARHTLAVHLLRKTGNLRQVQKQLGHSSPTITAAMYADVTFEDMQDGLSGLYS